MQLAKRTATNLVVAAFVPLLLLGFLQLAVTLAQTRDKAEDKTLARATALQARIDAALWADLGSLAVMPELVKDRDWAGFRLIAQRIMADHPPWKNIVLTDVDAKVEIWEVTDPNAGGKPARPSVLAFAKSGLDVAVDGFAGSAPGCGCIALRRRFLHDGAVYVMTIDRGVDDLQSAVLATVAAGETAAVVDRESRFIGRNVDFQNRLGTTATQFVQDAVARSGSGIYSGRTFEGLENRTAFATSALSGWSSHIAVPVATFNLLNAGSLTLSVMAVGVALLFAGIVVIFAVRDIAARRLAERARVQSQKLEAIGHLSGTVAHDFNNLLGVMVACLRILGRPNSEAKKEELIAEGLAAADRGAKLINQLLTFSREKPLELECVDLAKSVDGMRHLLERSLGTGVRCDIHVAPRARYATTNAAQLELALLNLAVNARDAMPKGGTFSIHTQFSPFTNSVDVVVRDTGMGMSDEVASRALEPFFTTKEEGKGTGLGLSQVNLLAHQSNGAILLDTAPGKGTQFTLRFRACTPAPSVERGKTA